MRRAGEDERHEDTRAAQRMGMWLGFHRSLACNSRPHSCELTPFVAILPLHPACSTTCAVTSARSSLSHPVSSPQHCQACLPEGMQCTGLFSSTTKCFQWNIHVFTECAMHLRILFLSMLTCVVTSAGSSLAHPVSPPTTARFVCLYGCSAPKRGAKSP